MEILEKIFGGAPRVKLMRLFLFNPSATFIVDEIASRSKIQAARVRKELIFLQHMHMVRSRAKGSKKIWMLNANFPYLAEFQRLLIETSLITPQTIIKKLSKLGSLKVLILAGLFKEEWDARLDMLIVVDRAKRSAVESVLSLIEAEIGREIRYAILDSTDFKYRISVGDKLVRDVLDYPHEIALDRINAFAEPAR